ncbi:DinB family protein [Massilia pseudoviolaceinigra]|uniref:DinB family protein n=1 Tax=Massilia pseudoviolaceinigra TaxID=3057165 RepID=UPI002796B0CB|nr:DinB family protein [Massilia sp. CCM 9206]MDQ1920542.1 DinB family protein [Massilia sp. CCM 9206]
MSELAHLRLMAGYNAWMNQKLYAAAATLPAHELAAERGAFFGSLLGTLNHLVAGDTIWLRRFATHPARFAALEPVLALAPPSALDAIHSDDLAVLAAHRRMLDAMISAWSAQLSDVDLEHVLHYASTKGIASQKRFGDLLLHFFNHQTHHRGQASTLLSQAGADLGVTDLLMLIENVEEQTAPPGIA